MAGGTLDSLLWKLGLNDVEFNEKLDGAVEHVGLFAEKMHAAFEIAEGSMMLVFLEKLISKATEIHSTAEALDLTTDSVQALDFVAKQANVSTDTLHAALGILKDKAAQAADGNSQVKDTLEKLGLKADEFIRLPLDKQLEAVARGAAEAEDKNAAFASVAALIGERNAPKLNAVLRELAEQGLDGVTNSAKQLGQVMDAQAIERMEKLENRIGVVKNALYTFGATVVEGWGKIADIAGTLAGNIVNVAQGLESTDIDAVTLEKHLSAGEAAVEKMNTAMKGTRATSEEIAKAAETQAKARESAQLAEMDGVQKIQFYREKLNKLAEEEQKFSANTKEQLKLQNEAAEVGVKLAEEMKKQQEEIAKKADELARKSQLAKNEALEMIRLEIQGVGHLSEAERIRLAQLKLIAEQKKIQADIDDMLAIPAEKRNQNENDWLRLCIKQNDELQKQIDAKGVLIASAKAQANTEATVTQQIIEQVQEVYKLNDAFDQFVVKLSRIGNGDNTHLTDRQLQEKINNLQATIDANRDFLSIHGFDDPASIIAKGDIARAKAEQDTRRQFRYEASALGVDKALGLHSAFDEERLKSYLSMGDNTEKMAKTIDTIDQRLQNSGLFPKQGFPQ